MDSFKKIKNIFFRINFNEKIGFGHLLRMLIVKKIIDNKRKKIIFIVDKINSKIKKNRQLKNIVFIELYKNKNYINYKDDIKFLEKSKSWWYFDM